MKNRITFIINPISGAGSKDKKVNIIESLIDKSKYDYEIVFTEYAGHASAISAWEVKKGTGIVVAVGGDGSVNEIAKELINTDTVLGIIPAGSGNGLAHHLGIPVNIKKAIDILNNGSVLRMDTGTINDKVFISIAGIGFDALVAAKYRNVNRRGFVSYLKIVTEEYPRYKPKKYKITINGQTIKERALFLIFANSDQFGYNASIAPGARVDDGLIDVVIAGKPLVVEMPIIAGLMYGKKIDKSKYVKILKADEVVVKMKKKRWVNVDGEAFKMKKTLHIKVNPRSLKVLVP